MYATRRTIAGSAPRPMRHTRSTSGGQRARHRLRVAAAAAAMAIGCDGAAQDTARPAGPYLVDIAEAVGLTRVHTGGGPDKEYIVEAKGGGGAVLDVEGDGDVDLYWVNGATLEDPAGAGNALYRNDGAAGFRDIAVAAGVTGRGWGMGAASADIDNDGDADLYVTCLQDDILYRNETTADAVAFADASAAVGIERPGWSTGAGFGDYDGDGDLDLYVTGYAEFSTDRVRPLDGRWRGARVFYGPVGLPAAPDHLLRNDDGHLVDVTETAGVDDVEPAYGLGVLFVDVDDDGDVDLFVANDSRPNFLFRNDGGRFVDASLEAGVAYGGRGASRADMGVAWGDYDGDLQPDILVTHFENDHNTLYRNEGTGGFTEATGAAGLGTASFPWVSFGASFGDLDNDGDLDLFVANGHVYPQIEGAGTGSLYAQPNQLFENLGKGSFRLVGAESGLRQDRRLSRSAMAGDIDNDGDLDLYVHNLNDRPSLLRNDYARGHWLGVRLVGTQSNRDGVGARLHVVAGDHVQMRDALRGSSFLSSEDPRIHFGLGAATAIDCLVVRWPSGRRQVVTSPPVDGYLTVVEE